MSRDRSDRARTLEALARHKAAHREREAQVAYVWGCCPIPFYSDRLDETWHRLRCSACSWPIVVRIHLHQGLQHVDPFTCPCCGFSNNNRFQLLL